MPIIKQQSPQLINIDERQRPRDFNGLVAELEADDSTARRWAARDLAEFPESVEVLVRRLKYEGDPSVRETILTTLIRLGNPATMTELVECLRSEDAALRNEVIEAMKELPDEVAPIMSELLADHDPDVRIFAVNILESLCHPQVEEWLIKVIEQDPHVNVCATALDLLGEVGTTASRLGLEQLKARFAEEPYIGFAADLAIKRIDES
ncbi:MAG: HEAT repeat domain-containing protein [Methylobacter sp.]|nr:HEAT repeat domain-containing protein [Methylobacter sp.]MDP2099018.1 HEAT repeat domain-containing protein [Methylobacter sp.]MDP2427623.1 HEAT repeat domain-containing protein [Methylobacter sp.]MDP3056846.1 HEAT repeat domain-containing protein [Methylobacter sp.]MDP3363515.1 HEAT repeat domain-containing protein [Methylobacter sp.]